MSTVWDALRVQEELEMPGHWWRSRRLVLQRISFHKLDF